MKEHSGSKIKVGDAAVELLETSDHEFIGLGGVTISGVPLRSPQRPLILRLSTPTGILYTRLLVQEVQADGLTTTIVLRALGFPWERSELHDWYNQPEIHFADSYDWVEDEVRLVLAPQTLTLREHQFTGFSYQVRFRSDARQVHRVLTHATWEIGGRLTGNTVLNRGQCNMPVYRGETELFYTTACINNLFDFHHRPHDYSYQLAGRGGLTQAFDFQHSAAGVLFQYWPDFRSVHSLCESRAGSDLLHVIDEYRVELSPDVATTPKHVLFHAGDVPEHLVRDLWWEAQRLVDRGIRRRYGLGESLTRTEMDLPNRDTVRVVAHDRIQLSVNKEWVDPEDYLYAIADRVIPFLARQGFKRFGSAFCIQVSDVTELGYRNRFEQLRSLHGCFHAISVCGTHRFLPAEFFGGLKAWRYLYAAGHKQGMQIGHWFGTFFTMRAPVFQEHPEWFMRDIDGRYWGGGQGQTTLVVGDWSSPLRDWVLDDFQRWQEEGGLDFICTDSWGSVAMNSLHYGDHMRTNLDGLGQFYRGLQQLGITEPTFEGISPFGPAHIGLADAGRARVENVPGIWGQNSFDWWLGAEDMAFDVHFEHMPQQPRTTAELRASLARVMAARGGIAFQQFYREGEPAPEWVVALNHIYNQVVDEMQIRHLLAERAGIRWANNQTEILWAWRDQPLALRDGQSLEEVTPTGPVPLAGAAGTTQLRAEKVYRIRHP